MKNQYFADINDYKKYGLLRLLSGGGGAGGLKTTVCWMLTPNDHGADGNSTGYLDDPAKWRRYDPEAFDVLKQCMAQPNGRAVSWVESTGLVPAATHFSSILSDNADQRRQYFAEMRSQIAGQDLVFFDPDTGIEVKSTRYGCRDSSRYIYWNELADAYAQGQSLLIYQHFPRISRGEFIWQMVGRMHDQMPVPMAFAFSTANVLFLLAPQRRHVEYLKERCAQIKGQWGEQIRVEQYQRI